MTQEKTMPVVGYENEYLVSDTGDIYSLPRKGTFNSIHKMSIQLSYDGYQTVKLCKNGKMKRFSVHRLVAAAFIPNPKKLATVNHKNEIKTDNRVENLEWMSDKDNRNYGTGIERARKSHFKPVVAVNAQSLEAKHFVSLTSTETDGFRPDCVNKVLMKKVKTHKGHYFFFKKEYEKVKSNLKTYNRGKPIKSIDLKTGKEEYFPSQKAAVRTGKYTANSINACLKGRRSTHKGKKWIYTN